MFDLQQDTIKRIVEDLRRSRRLLFVTGAGISADSGLPTYRGIGGLYNEELTEESLPIEVALSGEMMETAPHIPWKYIHQIEQSCRGASCNTAHRIIAEMQNHFDVWVLTQNIDGFHRDAGSLNLIEIHGDIHDLHCTACSYKTTVLHYADLDIPPSCPNCRAVLRPRVVLFGELLPEQSITLLYQQLGLGFDMVFSIGTTSVFPYIAGPVIEASRAGVPTVEINPGQTTVSGYVDYKVAAGAADTLDRIWQTYLEVALLPER
ncbi:MAG: NAD-dependent protein deacylase [Gammaproteobacteria bacterium]|nr:NAD-dependent protein deacylase [Gammaproteobacteria bacterium]MCP5425399.1 NAD-dependent protein deacylase [Gammaproteobacteria bacterium]MCP5459273.1 NAD-dependent protein deacylase [Gammaproteobacteria bacterium]